MIESEKIKQLLEEKYGFLKGEIRVQRKNRIWAEVSYSEFSQVFDHAVKNLDFIFIATITGLDEGENLAFIYHLYRKDGIVFSLKTRVLKDKGAIQSITNYFPGAAIYERELVDLFGAKVENLPEGPHYPLPDDWPGDQHPLRKDWDKSVLGGTSNAG